MSQPSCRLVLGRDAIDVSSTVAKLEKIGIRVHCLALEGVDLTSSAGKMTMNVINAVASSSAISSSNELNPVFPAPRPTDSLWGGHQHYRRISRLK